MTYIVFAVGIVTSANSRTRWAVVTPTGALLSVGTIPSHVASIAADTADNVGCEVLFLWAVVLPVADHAAVLASLVLIIAKGTVEGRKFSKLVALQFILAFGNGSSLRKECQQLRGQ